MRGTEQPRLLWCRTLPTTRCGHVHIQGNPAGVLSGHRPPRHDVRRTIARVSERRGTARAAHTRLRGGSEDVTAKTCTRVTARGDPRNTSWRHSHPGVIIFTQLADVVPRPQACYEGIQ